MEVMTHKPHRPGMVTFASVLLFIIGGIGIAVAISEFYEAAWLSSYVQSVFGDRFNDYNILWGVIDLVIAAVIFYAGADILRGGKFGLYVAYIIAAIAAVRWFFLFPWAPLASLIIIAISLAIIFGLANSEEYFTESRET